MAEDRLQSVSQSTATPRQRARSSSRWDARHRATTRRAPPQQTARTHCFTAEHLPHQLRPRPPPERPRALRRCAPSRLRHERHSSRCALVGGEPEWRTKYREWREHGILSRPHAAGLRPERRPMSTPPRRRKSRGYGTANASLSQERPFTSARRTVQIGMLSGNMARSTSSAAQAHAEGEACGAVVALVVSELVGGLGGGVVGY